ncbi:MAG: DUF4158 domain-containing protein [Actinomycetota bacterium]|nr:DUF4158 domain-containing protein [Actinomycetota bacterium]
MTTGGLPAEELQRLSSWPAEVARSDLASYCTFSLQDLRWVRSHRGAGERIGLAVQFAALGLLGFIPAELGDTPPELARHVGNQIGVAAATFSRYAREVDGRTRRRHVAAVVEHAGWRACAQPEWNALAEWLTERVFIVEDGGALALLVAGQAQGFAGSHADQPPACAVALEADVGAGQQRFPGHRAGVFDDGAGRAGRGRTRSR